MDLLDPLDDSGEHVVETKVIISDIKQAMESDDEQVVEHLSPQTLLETPGDGDVQYSVRGTEGIITYRVLQVGEESVDNHVPQIISNGPTFTNAAVPQVLTSNLNGQLYVISNSNDVFTSQSGTRAIAPRSSLVETSSSYHSNTKQKDERRRATHNEVERRRRDKINNWITKLSKIIPESTAAEMKGNGHYDGQSKGVILAKACEYINELRDTRDKLTETVEILKQKNYILENENKEYRDMLKRSGIDLPNNDIVS